MKAYLKVAGPMIGQMALNTWAPTYFYMFMARLAPIEPKPGPRH